jgi:DNA (cytosine-5)-methyltransferase 1
VSLRVLELFAGAGGGLLSSLILGHEPVAAVEWDPYCCQVLRERAAEGWFPGLQVFEGDVRLFPASDWKGRVDCIHAGFPCPPFSVAGKRRGGADERNMWPATARIVGEVRPEWVFLENVAGFVSSGYGWTVLSDLSGLGYDALWTCLGADQVGAPHRRERWWCLAYAQGREIDERERGTMDETEGRGEGLDSSAVPGGSDVAYAFNNGSHRQKRNEAKPGGDEQKDGVFVGDDKDVADAKDDGFARGGDEAGDWGSERVSTTGGGVEMAHRRGIDGSRTWRVRGVRDATRQVGGVVDGLAADVVRRSWWEEEPDIGRVSKGEENRVAKLKALGNGQVPLQSATAFTILMGQIGGSDER